MLVQRGRKLIQYCLYELMRRRKAIKKTKQREHKTISLQTLFICLRISIYACAILSPIDSNKLWTPHVMKCLEI